jgi:thymidylate synthase (FAD)
MIDVTLIDSMGSDLTVVNAARVSFNKKSEWGSDNELKSTDRVLISYLARHKHMSPFGHCFATFHVRAPVFVARQLVKHKFLRWNEVSRRYVDEEPEFFYPSTSVTKWRGRADDKKQGSRGVVEISNKGISALAKHEIWCVKTYRQLLEDGVAPEQARIVLPQSTMTEWYWSGSLDAWSDMCKLRQGEDAQEETRLVANSISMDMGTLYPESWAALVAYNR